MDLRFFAVMEEQRKMRVEKPRSRVIEFIKRAYGEVISRLPRTKQSGV